MNRDILNHMIEHPELPPDVTPEQLAEITGRYPYFSAAHQLLTRLYQQNGDHRFSDQVQQAAVYASDRRKLYNYLKQPAPQLKNAAKTPETETPTAAATTVIPLQIATNEFPEAPASKQKKADVAAATQEPLHATLPSTDAGASSLAGLIFDEDENEAALSPQGEHSAVQRPAEVKIETTPLPELATSTEEPTTPKEEEAPALPVATTHLADIDPLEREILLEAMQSSMELEVTPEPEEEATEDPNSYAAWIYRRSRRIHFGDKPAVNSSTDEPSNEQEEVPALAADWMRNDQQENEPEVSSGELSESNSEDLPAFGNQPLSHGMKRLMPTDGKSHQRDLIDRFIRLEPNISRGKAAEYTSGNIAKESLEEDFTFVTETMAQLYAQQGKLDKARKAYKKLIELYPEKSIYFAAQLKNLEKHKK
jgi:tetratricopeptide (TPR) repeat protein